MSRNAAAANAAAKPAANSIEMPPIIVEGPSFTIYGEIHNDIDNRFYERLYGEFDDSNDRILVEKTTYKPFLQTDLVALGMSKDKKKLISKVKGAEWIYLTRLVNDKKVEPIDIRVENGFPNAYQEHHLFDFAIEEPIDFVNFIIEITKVISAKKEYYNKQGIKELFVSIMAQTKKQIISFLSESKEGKVNQDNLNNLCTHIRYLSVLFFDSNLMNMILQNNRKRKQNKKHLHIFVGARHAINLYIFLQQNGLKDLTIRKTAKGESIEPVKVLE